MMRLVLVIIGICLSTAVLPGCNLNPDAEDDSDTVESDGDRDSEKQDAGLPSDLTQCAYGTGVYPNYFLNIGYSEEAVAGKLETA